MPSQDRAVLLLLSSTLTLMSVACSSENSNAPTQPVATPATPSTAINPPVKPSPKITPTSQPTLTPKEAYERALDVAYSAAVIAQSAESPDDWQLVSKRWQEAIELLQSVPPKSSYRAMAQSKIAQYQRNLSIAKQQATRPRSNSSSETVAAQPRAAFTPSTPSPSPSPNAAATPIAPSPKAPTTQPNTSPENARVFKAPIKRRVRGTPVIDVTFNGSQTFEMVLDTGASGTVITQAMAQSLGIVSQGEVKANTASAKGVRFRTGTVESIAVNGAVERNVQVAIAGPDLEIGLLGQDFFSRYDVSIRQNVVEFHSR